MKDLRLYDKDSIYCCFIYFHLIILYVILLYRRAIPLYLIYHFQKILTILILEHRLCQLTHLGFIYPSFSVSNAFKTGYFKSLTLLQHLNICTCLGQRVVSTRVKPCKSTSECLYLQFCAFQELLVDSCNLILSTRWWLNIACLLYTSPSPRD